MQTKTLSRQEHNLDSKKYINISSPENIISQVDKNILQREYLLTQLDNQSNNHFNSNSYPFLLFNSKVEFERVQNTNYSFAQLDSTIQKTYTYIFKKLNQGKKIDEKELDEAIALASLQTIFPHETINENNYQEKLEEIFDEYLKGNTKEFERYEELYQLIYKSIPPIDIPYAGGIPAEELPEKFEVPLPYEAPAKGIPKWLAYLGLAVIGGTAAFTGGLLAYAKTGHDKQINELRENSKKIPVVGGIIPPFFEFIGLGDKDKDEILDINDKWPDLHNFPAQKYAREKGLSEEIIKNCISEFDEDLYGGKYDIPGKGGKPVLTWYAKKIIDLLASLPGDKQKELSKYLEKYSLYTRYGNIGRDVDQDGLTDIAEVKLGLNPFDKDTDKDGIWDFNEVMVYPHELDAKNPEDAKEFLKKIPNVYAQNPFINEKKLGRKLGCGVWGAINGKFDPYYNGSYQHPYGKLIKIMQNDPVVKYYAKRLEFKKLEGKSVEHLGGLCYKVLVDGETLWKGVSDDYVPNNPVSMCTSGWAAHYLTTAKRKGCCSDIAWVSTVLLDLNGYPVKMMSGIVREGFAHAWTETKINGKIYAIVGSYAELPEEHDKRFEKNTIRCLWKNDKADW
jgi:hypothetical protein